MRITKKNNFSNPSPAGNLGEGGTMYAVYKASPAGGIEFIALFEHEIEAADYCDRMDWMYIDDNGDMCTIDYKEV